MHRMVSEEQTGSYGHRQVKIAKRPILITLLITLLGSVSDLLDFQWFSDSEKYPVPSNPLRSTILGSANALPFFVFMNYYIDIDIDIDKSVFAEVLDQTKRESH